MTNATQLSLGEATKRLSKPAIAGICAGAIFLGLLGAYLLTHSSNSLKADALQILSNQTAWWTEEGKIKEWDAQIAILEGYKTSSREEQARLAAENDALRQSINDQLAGF